MTEVQKLIAALLPCYGTPRLRKSNGQELRRADNGRTLGLPGEAQGAAGGQGRGSGPRFQGLVSLSVTLFSAVV